MAHIDYNKYLWEEYCRIANSIPENEITRKPRFLVSIQSGGKSEQCEIILISSEKILVSGIYYQVNMKDNLEKVPGARWGCEGYWINIGTQEKPESHMVVTSLFVNQPEYYISTNCIIYLW